MKQKFNFFSENLKRIRLNLGKTQEEFGKEFGKHRAVISQYEEGRNYPTLDTLVKIVQVYNLNAHDLLFKKGYGDKELADLFEQVNEPAAGYSEVDARIDVLEKNVQELDERIARLEKLR